MDKGVKLNNLCCDLSEIVITKDIRLTEDDISILLCGLTLYKDSLDRLNSKTEYICKELRRINALKKILQLMALAIEEDYNERN